MKKPGRIINQKYERAGLMMEKKPIASRSTHLYSSFFVGLVLLMATAFPAIAATSAESRQSLFASPEDARQALVDAAKAKDRAALGEIFGPDNDKLLSGDPVQDDHELDQFVAALDQSAKLQPSPSGDKVTLTVGADNWPFPIPIVKQGEKWLFDTKAGTEEILNRRIGENELSAIATCRAYVLAQWEYFTEGDHDNDGVAEYAQHFASSPGQKDGLYWETAEGEKPSPMGALVAAARLEGYTNTGKPRVVAAKEKEKAVPRQRNPYHGYYFKILKKQGAHAPGGKYDYVINGNMIAGYALIAYPDKWGSSGVMTFMVNQQGRVYQKNLGADTAKIAPEIKEYDPDSTWKLVNE
ncbi:MAG TPA: DUF2950 domain-containing protein [Candidatus Binatia bacterium]|nr:DUF2950 domain-containing protein [Candidatus Binatia bacterium]